MTAPLIVRMLPEAREACNAEAARRPARLGAVAIVIAVLATVGVVVPMLVLTIVGAVRP
jgi:hypothetical protein